MHGAASGVHAYVPVLLGDVHFGVVGMHVHSALLDLRFRRAPSKAARRRNADMARRLSARARAQGAVHGRAPVAVVVAPEARQRREHLRDLLRERRVVLL